MYSVLLTIIIIIIVLLFAEVTKPVTFRLSSPGDNNNNSRGEEVKWAMKGVWRVLCHDGCFTTKWLSEGKILIVAN